MAATPFGKTIPRGATSFYDFSQNDDGKQPGATSTQDDGGNDTPVTPTMNGNNGSSSSSTTTTTTVTSPYAQFKGNNYAELEEFLRGQMDAIKPETKEKREKRIGFLARLAEGLGTFHTAFSHARGTEAMDMPKMSARAKELFEKAKAQRDKDNDRLVNYVITLDKLNSSKAQSDYQQKTLAIRQQQQDRLDKQEETNRSIAEAKVKYYEAQSNKNDEQAAYWKTKAELLERGWPQEQAEQAARVEERKARAAKYNHDANAPYRTGGSSSSGGRSSGGGTQSAGTEKVTEKTDARGHTTTTRTYTQPRQRQGGTSRSGKTYSNTKKLGL